MIYNRGVRMPIGKVDFFTRRRGKNARAQSTLEFTLIIVCVVAALLAMGRYIRRGMQGRLRLNVEPLGKQFDPDKTGGAYTTVTNSSSRMWAETQTEEHYNVRIDLDEDGALEDVVFGRTSSSAVDSTTKETGHEITN